MLKKASILMPLSTKILHLLQHHPKGLTRRQLLLKTRPKHVYWLDSAMRSLKQQQLIYSERVSKKQKWLWLISDRGFKYIDWAG